MATDQTANPRLKAYLDGLADEFEQPSFISADPVSIPHGFDAPEDQEIVAFYAALLAWGRRETVLNKMAELCKIMRFQPHRFVRNFNLERDAHRLAAFKHRTFQPDDAIWLTAALSAVLARFGSLETLFGNFLRVRADHVGDAIQGASTTLMSIVPNTPPRLQKHLARPESGSSCKRINLFLRWMVRPGPVDLGIWESIQTSQLLIPLDVHAGRQARLLGLLHRKQNDWRSVLELTDMCRRLDPVDPIRYDYVFFGMGATGRSFDSSFLSE